MTNLTDRLHENLNLYESAPHKILQESIWRALNEDTRNYLNEWDELEKLLTENAQIFEAELTAGQINTIFTNAEKYAVDSGNFQTGLGKAGNMAADAGKAVGGSVKLAAGVVSKANAQLNKLGAAIADTTPVKGIDAAFEKAKKDLYVKLGGKDSKVNQVVMKMSQAAKDHPGKTKFLIGALTIAASLAAGPAGGAAAGYVLRGASDLLAGEKLSTAVGKGLKTAAMGYLSGKAFEWAKEAWQSGGTPEELAALANDPKEMAAAIKSGDMPPTPRGVNLNALQRQGTSMDLDDMNAMTQEAASKMGITGETTVRFQNGLPSEINGIPVPDSITAGMEPHIPGANFAELRKDLPAFQGTSSVSGGFDDMDLGDITGDAADATTAAGDVAGAAKGAADATADATAGAAQDATAAAGDVAGAAKGAADATAAAGDAAVDVAKGTADATAAAGDVAGAAKGAADATAGAAQDAAGGISFDNFPKTDSGQLDLISDQGKAAFNALSDNQQLVLRGTENGFFGDALAQTLVDGDVNPYSLSNELLNALKDAGENPSEYFANLKDMGEVSAADMAAVTNNLKRLVKLGKLDSDFMWVESIDVDKHNALYETARLKYMAGMILTESEQLVMREGPLDAIKKIASNAASAIGKGAAAVATSAKAAGRELGQNITAKKLNRLWAEAGEPTDEPSIASILAKAGLDNDSIAAVATTSKVSLPAPAQPAPTATAEPTATDATAEPTAAAEPTATDATAEPTAADATAEPTAAADPAATDATADATAEPAAADPAADPASTSATPGTNTPVAAQPSAQGNTSGAAAPKQGSAIKQGITQATGNGADATELAVGTRGTVNKLVHKWDGSEWIGPTGQPARGLLKQELMKGQGKDVSGAPIKPGMVQRAKDFVSGKTSGAGQATRSDPKASLLRKVGATAASALGGAVSKAMAGPAATALGATPAAATAPGATPATATAPGATPAAAPGATPAAANKAGGFKQSQVPGSKGELQDDPYEVAKSALRKEVDADKNKKQLPGGKLPPAVGKEVSDLLTQLANGSKDAGAMAAEKILTYAKRGYDVSNAAQVFLAKGKQGERFLSQESYMYFTHMLESFGISWGDIGITVRIDESVSEGVWIMSSDLMRLKVLAGV